MLVILVCFVVIFAFYAGVVLLIARKPCPECKGEGGFHGADGWVRCWRCARDRGPR